MPQIDLNCERGACSLSNYGPLLGVTNKSMQQCGWWHYSDVIMSSMLSQITGVSVVDSAACSDADQRKHQSSASLAFVRGIHRSPVNSPHKGPVTRKMFPFDDVIVGFYGAVMYWGAKVWRYASSAIVNPLITWKHNSPVSENLPDSKVHGANMGPVGPRWAPCWPHEPCYYTCVDPIIMFVFDSCLFNQASATLVPYEREIW